jgi:hypothetical protein
MILKETFTKKHIDEIIKNKKCDPVILERAIVALGLVEALAKTGCDFIFKGGSSLMLLLDDVNRLSTDCDIIVPVDYDIDSYIKNAAVIYPFKSYSESVRKTNNNISKKHYKFVYDSIYFDNGDVVILLDVLFENNVYKNFSNKEINNNLLLCDENPIFVKCPTVEAILGDKLTAFAPETTGIKFYNDDYSNDKKLEVIKQFYDIVVLFRNSSNFYEIRDNYLCVVKNEIAYRGLDISYEDALLDTFKSSLSILSRGKIYPTNYSNFLDGIKKIRNHIFSQPFTAEIAVNYAADVLLLTAGVLSNVDVVNAVIPNGDLFTDDVYKNINYVRKMSKTSFDKSCFAINILINNGFIKI